jgi:hypothetical protein
MKKKINKHAATRLIYGFMFTLLGAYVLIWGEIACCGGHTAYIQLGAYKYFLGGFFLLAGIYYTYHAFAKD